LATVTGSVFVNSSSSIFLGDASRMELPAGQTITHEGELELLGGPTLAAELDADVVNDGGVFRIRDANANRGVTMLADSEMFVENASVDSLDQVGGNVNFSLRSAFDFDDLFVVDTATFGPNATFVMSLGEGFTPTLGMTFPIFTAGSIIGAPTLDFSAAPLGSGLAWLPIQLATSLSLAVVSSSTPGDFDGDGDVDGRDFLLWQRGGSPDPLSSGDLADWQGSYGVGPLSASTAVPEPGGAFLGIFAAALLRSCYRSRLPCSSK